MDKYICPIDIDVNTFTSGTVYFSLFNTHTSNIGINKILLQTMSATGSGNTKCMYAVARSSVVAPTGGSTVSYTKMSTSQPTIIVDIRKSNLGLTVTSTIIDPYFHEVAVKTGSEGHSNDIEFDDEFGLILAPTQGIVILADDLGISGASLHGRIEFCVPDTM